MQNARETINLWISINVKKYKIKKIRQIMEINKTSYGAAKCNFKTILCKQFCLIEFQKLDV